jgi:hypothetical protein
MLVGVNTPSIIHHPLCLSDSLKFAHATGLRVQEGQQVGVNSIGLGRGHAVRKTLIGL